MWKVTRNMERLHSMGVLLKVEHQASGALVTINRWPVDHGLHGLNATSSLLGGVDHSYTEMGERNIHLL
jgi:hypothetical protein